MCHYQMIDAVAPSLKLWITRLQIKIYFLYDFIQTGLYHTIRCAIYKQNLIIQFSWWSCDCHTCTTQTCAL